MDYELAKELKDAGFPQVFHPKGGMEFDGYLDEDYETGSLGVATPTLEELIEACGEEFGSLYQSHFGWIADKGLHELEQHGETPSEAVARLWLALNKK